MNNSLDQNSKAMKELLTQYAECFSVGNLPCLPYPPTAECMSSIFKTLSLIKEQAQAEGIRMKDIQHTIFQQGSWGSYPLIDLTVKQLGERKIGVDVSEAIGLEVVNHLLKEGCDPLTPNSYGYHAIDLLVGLGYNKILNRLLEHSDHRDIINSPRSTKEFALGLHWAICARNEEAAILLMEHGDSINLMPRHRNILNAAIENETIKVLDFLHQKGVNFHQVCTMTHESALHLATKIEKSVHWEVLEFLIGLGLDVDLKNPIGLTPLHNLVSHGDFDLVVKFIEEGGARADIDFPSGKTLEATARTFGYVEMANYLQDIALVQLEKEQITSATKRISEGVLEKGENRPLRVGESEVRRL